MQAAAAEPATLVGQFAQLFAKLSVNVPRGTVPHTLAIGIDDPARPPLAHPMAVPEMSHSFALRARRQNFLPGDPSAPLCPALHRPADASTSRCRFRVPSAAEPPKPRARHTSTSSCRSSLPLYHIDGPNRRSSLQLRPP
jgi:hypothetical protein